MKKSLVVAFVMSLSSQVFAEPDQIEVIGIIPGVSTEAEVDAIKSKEDGSGVYIIGGYSMPWCEPTYAEGILIKFTCLTGKKRVTKDVTSSSHERVSNIKVHHAWVDGFTEKFGPPTLDVNQILENGLGIEFTRNVVVWDDKKGTKLTLFSVSNKADEGGLLLQSAKDIKMGEEEQKAKEKKRKF